MNIEQAARQVVRNYQDGLNEGDSLKVRQALGSQVMMFNGNYSTNPADFQAHLFLAGGDLDEWARAFVQEAGPHMNRYEFVHTHIRANAAVVVTRDSGQNKYRQWEDELVTWLLGQADGAWKIVGLFYRDLSNPGE